MSDKTLVQHMAEVMKEVGYVQKDATNDFQKYTYASAQAVFDKVRKELSSRGIAVCGDVELVASEIVGSKDKHLVVAKHTITFTDGTDQLLVSALGEGIDAGDKASMKANTAAVKYCLAKAFLISWGDDPEDDDTTDADAKSDRRERGKHAVQQEEIPTDPITLPQDYPDVNALVLDHSGKRGINELRNVVVSAKSKGWTEGKLLEWIKAQGVDLADSELKYSTFVKLNAAMRGA